MMRVTWSHLATTRFSCRWTSGPPEGGGRRNRNWVHDSDGCLFSEQHMMKVKSSKNDFDVD